MSEMQRLIRDLSASPDLQERLLRQTADVDAAVVVARDEGYAITKEEAIDYVKGMQGGIEKELSDTQLDSVSGGKRRTNKFKVLVDNTVAPQIIDALGDGQAWKDAWT